MLDKLEPIGSIKVPSGALEFGNVGQTACVFLRFVGGPGAVPIIVYTPEELNSLLAIVGYAEKLAQSTQPGNILRLGAMRAKPIILRVALIHPNQGPPFVLLRMIQGRGKLDIPVPILSALDLFRRGEARDPAPPVCGMLRRDPNGVWLVAGKELHVIPNETAGHDYFGQYLNPGEVREGEEIVAWTFSQDGKEHVGAFRTLQQWQPPARVEQPMAQEGDVALFHGETYRCRQIHKTFAQSLMHSGNVDPTWAAKIALSSLLCDIADGEDETGHATWIGNSPEPILKLGISAIEQGQTSAHDLALYQQVSCYFHSLAADQDSAAHAVNTIMERLFDHISENDPQQRRRLLGNWAMHLKDIYDGKPPAEASQSWKDAKARYPGRVVPRVISFPPPYAWIVDWVDQEQDAPPGAIPAPASPVAAAPAGPSAPASISDPPITEEEEPAGVLFDSTDPPSTAPVAATEAGLPPAQPETEDQPARPGATKSKAPLIAVGALLAIGLGVGALKAMSGGEPVAQASPTASSTPAAVSPSPAAPATPAATPAVSASASPASGATPVLGDLSSLGKLSIGTIDPDGKYYVDRDVPGMKMLEQGSGWARYEKDGSQVFMGAKQSGTRKSTRATAFASDTLYSDDQKVLSAGVTRDQIPEPVLERLANMRIDVVVDESTDTVLGFSTGDFPDTCIALGQPLGANLLQAFENRDLEAFKAGLTPEKANLLYMDGETLFSKIAQHAGVNEYCQALIDAGADVKGTSGSKALWATSDPGIAAMLTRAGLSPDDPGPQGRTKLFEAGPEMARVLLEAGANPNSQDENGASPLFTATEPAAIANLIKAGAKPNLTDKEGRTALMGADLEKTKALLAGGADPSLKDKAGRDAIDYAGPDVEVVTALRKARAGGKPPGKATPSPAPTPG